MEMQWYDYLVLLGLVGLAIFFLFKSIAGKKWCPDVFGNKGCGLEAEKSQGAEKKHS